MLMILLPTRFTLNSFMRWLGIKDNPSGLETRRLGDNPVDMCFSQYQVVDARILDFLRKGRTDDHNKTTARSVA
jgi:hypothetical protein